MSLLTDLFSAPQDNIHQKYAELREMDEGVHVDHELNMVLITRHADAERVYRRKGPFSSDTFLQSAAGVYDPADPKQVHYAEYFKNFLLFLDPPNHTRLRNLVRHAFTPDAVGRMSTLIETASDQILGEFSSGDEIEFVSQIAERIPVQVIATMIGIPPQDRPQFRRWTQDMIDTLEPAVQGEERKRAIYGGYDMLEYLAEHVERRRGAPNESRDDLLGLLLNAQDEGDSLTTQELGCMLMVLLVAGNSTTTDLLGNAMVLLSEHPLQRADLIANPQLTELAVEEVARFEPSLRYVMRKTVDEEVELGGHTIKPDSLLWVCNASANRDPRRFEDPEAFDVRRENNRHLSFGGGMHYCLGAPLARLEARTMLTKFLARFPDTKLLVDGPAPYRPDFISRSLSELPMLLA